MKIHSLAASLLVFVSGCSPVTLLNAATPSAAFDRDAGAQYGTEPRQLLDVYRAKQARGGAPVVVFFYGGGWTKGERRDYKFVADAFASQGYDVVVPDYRLYPEVRYPAFVTDAARAVAWTHDAFPDRPIVLMGHSAGAYIALMLALDPEWLGAAGVRSCDVLAGVVGLSGPYGIVPLTEEPYVSIFPDRFAGKDAPLHVANGAAPRALLVNGAADRTVWPDNAAQLADALAQNGGSAEAKIYPGLNHIDTVRVLSRYFDGDAPVKADVLAFLKGLPPTDMASCDASAGQG